MKNLKQITLAVISVFAILGAVTSIYLFSTRQKTAYVNLTKIYNEFELKKQLEQQLTSVQQIRQKTLDSLELELKMLSRNLQSPDAEKNKAVYDVKANDFDLRKQDYLYKQKTFSDDNATLSQQYTDQIWKQLDQYVKDYGDAHDYTFILGGDGSGSMMYAAKGDDVTDILVTYTNERFKGESKKR
jgi:outer membrane protein